MIQELLGKTVLGKNYTIVGFTVYNFQITPQVLMYYLTKEDKYKKQILQRHLKSICTTEGINEYYIYLDSKPSMKKEVISKEERELIVTKLKLTDVLPRETIYTCIEDYEDKLLSFMEQNEKKIQETLDNYSNIVENWHENKKNGIKTAVVGPVVYQFIVKDEYYHYTLKDFTGTHASRQYKKRVDKKGELLRFMKLATSV